jgi:drug/metabolite transporter (DMT)-like permease
MRASNYVFLTLVVLGMASGQMLFKLAARSFSSSETLLRGILSPYLVVGLALYFVVTVAWVWQLSMIDLSRAYPFMALTFIVVPFLSTLVLGETTGTRYWLGIACIILGILIVQSDVSGNSTR